MPSNRKQIKALLYKIDASLQQLEGVVDERTKLHELGLQPSTHENEELSNTIHKTVEYLEQAKKEMEQERDEEIHHDLERLARKYMNIHSTSGSKIEAPEFTYEIPQPSKPPTAKAVRFKDIPDEADTSEMMGTQPFQPYRDDPEEAEEIDSRSNHQMFAEHQQTMMRQDQDLDHLHQSISRQHMMGKDIDQELDEQLIILNDLEQGVDNSGHRIQRATTRLNDFRRMARENGSLTTIIILTIILILLLVVLN
ncbi:hypothetical protein I9W82_000108 [Candida metapsilosis]|uniref:t-SNARE coiled-coil homology domain-containing protein n=1 Tax=Candida metapsilosis TaxID=273372 RepID=A0A8H7ZFS2_9ASCO|nr:hypothetical protein I9W82_000108 [Candida metapsilosis]